MSARRHPNTPGFTLRPAIEDDFAFIYAVRAAGMREYVDQIRGWNEADQFARFRARFDPASFVVIVVDRHDVGTMAVDWRSGEAFLADMYICPERQRQGLGTKVLRSVIDEATRRGVPVTLQVLKNNPARVFYERLGFRIEDVTETHFRMRTER